MTARCPVLVVPRGGTSALADWGDTAAASKTYSSEAVARRAVRALTAAGVPRRDIRLLTGRRLHDIRREAVGGFAGAVDPSAPVGTYAGAPCLRRQAPRSFAGDPDDSDRGPSPTPTRLPPSRTAPVARSSPITSASDGCCGVPRSAAAQPTA